jgi:hypothetical protein
MVLGLAIILGLVIILVPTFNDVVSFVLFTTFTFFTLLDCAMGLDVTFEAFEDVCFRFIDQKCRSQKDVCQSSPLKAT